MGRSSRHDLVLGLPAASRALGMQQLALPQSAATRHSEASPLSAANRRTAASLPWGASQRLEASRHLEASRVLGGSRRLEASQHSTATPRMAAPGRPVTLSPLPPALGGSHRSRPRQAALGTWALLQPRRPRALPRPLWRLASSSPAMSRKSLPLASPITPCPIQIWWRAVLMRALRLGRYVRKSKAGGLRL